MAIINQRQLEVSRKKLASLEEKIAELRLSRQDSAARHLTIQSMKKVANQIREEIVRYEVGAHAARG